MRCNTREVALSSALRDNSTCKLQCTLFLKLGSHYYREPPAPAGGGSTEKLTAKCGMRRLRKHYRTAQIMLICFGMGRSFGRCRKYRASASAGERNSTVEKPALRSFASSASGSKQLTQGSPKLAALWASGEGESPGGCTKVSTISLPAGNMATDLSTASM